MQSTLAVVSLKNILFNARALARVSGVPLVAVVKDDAYGHGAERVALALDREVSSFAVATAEEGASLKTAGVSSDVLVLTPALSGEEVLRCAEYGLVLTLSSFASLRLAERAAQKFGLHLRAHLAVNTGMNRYGFRPERAGQAAREAAAEGIAVEGVYSHFYAADGVAEREEQRECFLSASERVREYFPDAVRHLSATGGLLAGEKYRFDAVRAGISLYGYLPDGFDGAVKLKPAMKVYATVSHCGKALGDGAGYARADKRYGYLHTVRLGYGDGFFRAGTENSVGKLCMDAHLREGRAVFGARRLAVKDVSAYARSHGTTEYEALCNIARKAEKIYV